MKQLYPNFQNGWTVWHPSYKSSTVHKAYQYKDGGEIFTFVHHTNDGKPFVYHTGDCEGADVVYMEFLKDGDMILTTDGVYEIGYQVMSVEWFMIYYTNEQPKYGAEPTMKALNEMAASAPFVTRKQDVFENEGGFVTVRSNTFDASGGCYYPTTEKKSSWLTRLWRFITSKFK